MFTTTFDVVARKKNFGALPKILTSTGQKFCKLLNILRCFLSKKFFFREEHRNDHPSSTRDNDCPPIFFSLL